MFFSRRRPLAVREEQLRSLRLALNTPDLAAEDLPAGPARAAIAVREEADGGMALSVLVRSLGDGSLVCWSWDGVLAPDTLARAVDAALSFGEGMGFLFDDDALSEGSEEIRQRALDHWWELSGWSTADAPAANASALEAPCLAPPEEALAWPLPTAKERLPLTKFRRRLGGAAAEPLALAPRPEGSALGRLRLVKRARTEEAAERSSLWLRLLGSF